jgi:methylthioribose-1-phosphate isomerase
MNHPTSIAIEFENQNLQILDQQLLPHKETWLKIETVKDMILAIKALKVRGAPLIGVAAACALAQSALKGTSQTALLSEADELAEARPTAVNLMICVERMRKAILDRLNPQELYKVAIEIFIEDINLCEKISNNGNPFIKDGDNILTHCNAGALATAGIGTALGVIKRAHESGKKIHVYVDETRPLLQGGRLTAWEMEKAKIPYTLISDNMAGHLMSLGKINKAITGADRIAVNGDFANKIGTYSVAVLCKHHNIPFYVAAPYTTVDPQTPNGKLIPIEQRHESEVKGYGEAQWAPSKANVYNPSFDVTPAELVSAWILDKKAYTKSDIEKGVFKC